MNKKLGYLIPPLCSFLLMGNQSCQQTQPPRMLRMDVEIGRMKTLPLKVDSQEDILIDSLNKELFARAIFGHNRFSVMSVEQPNSNLTISAKSTNTNKPISYSSKDKTLLENYGFSSKNNQSFKALSTDSEIPSCQWEKPVLTLNSDVLGFELVNNTGIGIGYSPSGTLIDELKGKVKFTVFQLNYGITALSPLLQRTVAATNTVAYKSSVALAFDFGQGSPITLDFFYQDAMVSVIQAGMKQSLDQLVKQLQSQTTSTGKDWNKDVWESRVLFDPAICDEDNCIAIRGGTLNGVKIGDKFNVTKMIHSWAGEPCYSKLLRSIPDLTTKSEIVIESVGDTVSVGRMKLTEESKAIEAGAIVKVTQLNEPPPPQQSF